MSRPGIVVVVGAASFVMAVLAVVFGPAPLAVWAFIAAAVLICAGVAYITLS